MKIGWLALAFLVCGCVQQPLNEASISTTLPLASTSTTVSDVDIVYVLETTTTLQDTLTTTTTLVGSQAPSSTTTTLNPLIKTFKDNHGPVCKVDGKPVVRMYGRSDCDHCQWSGPVFDKLVKDYVNAGQIVAHHWDFLSGDDSITDRQEAEMPVEEKNMFYADNYQNTTVPYFDFGCRFIRVGTGYYAQNRQDKEADEFQAVIEQLININ
jgi:thiol-disulfide isomerase/thioredoxin